MVLARLFGVSQKDPEAFEFDNPKAYGTRYDDCLSCRIMGSTAFMALGGYTYVTGMRGLRSQRKAIEMSKSKYKYGSRQLGIISLSATLVGVGIFRMLN